MYSIQNRTSLLNLLFLHCSLIYIKYSEFIPVVIRLLHLTVSVYKRFQAFTLYFQLVNDRWPATISSAVNKRFFGTYGRSKVMRINHYQSQKGLFALQNKFSEKKNKKNYSFIVPSGPFHCVIIKTKLKRIQRCDNTSFLHPKWSFCLTKPITITFDYLLATFIVQKTISHFVPIFWHVFLLFCPFYLFLALFM